MTAKLIVLYDGCTSRGSTIPFIYFSVVCFCLKSLIKENIFKQVCIKIQIT